MKKFLSVVILSVGLLQLQAQQKQPVELALTPKTDKPAATNNRMVITDSEIKKEAFVTIKGEIVDYTAMTGTMPVWDEEGKPIASVFYTYYERNNVKDRAMRPLVISFNGGPGTSSVWMEIGYTGPRILNISDEGYPTQPYGVHENSQSILDVADIVYIDPVNTGFSRMVNKEVPGKTFFGVNADIKYLAEWLNTFVTRKNRWASPKYLIGESYGTTRVSGLALELQNAQWMYLNGVILVSPTGLGLEREGPVKEALMLPYYAATAWYHKMLPPDLQQKDLTDMLPEVEDFTINQLMPALAKGGYLPADEKQKMATTIARYSGLAEKVVVQHNLVIEPNFFWKELLRDKGFTVGRLDSRYRGMDREDAGENPDYNAELTAWEHAFTPAMNIYLREELNYKTDLKYLIFGNVWPWDQTQNRTGENLRQAMAQNPMLHLMVQSGYYDGACDYFNAKYNLWQLDPSGKLKDRMSWFGFRSGHMMYLRKPDLATANEQLRDFIKKSFHPGEPAKF